MSGSELGMKEEKERHTAPFSQWEDHIFHCPGKHCTLLGVVAKRAPMSPIQALPYSGCTGPGHGSWDSQVVPLHPKGNRILYYQRFLGDLRGQGFDASPAKFVSASWLAL